MSKLDNVVYVIDDSGQIAKGKIRDFDGYIEETTTPHGIAPKIHVRDNQLWTWGHQGNAPRMIREYETEAEAIEAMEETFYQDFIASGIDWYPSMEKAQIALESYYPDDEE